MKFLELSCILYKIASRRVYFKPEEERSEESKNMKENPAYVFSHLNFDHSFL